MQQLLERQRYFRYQPDTGEEQEVDLSYLTSAKVIGLYFGANSNPGSLKFTMERLVPFFFESNAT